MGRGTAENHASRGLFGRLGASLLVAVLLVASVLVCAPSRAEAAVTTYDGMLTQVTTLEGYATDWIAANPSATSLDAASLSAAYVRSTRYGTGEWNLVGGTVPADFITYCATQDADQVTNPGSEVQSLRTMGDITLPNGEATDTIHMFAVINTVACSTGDTGGDLAGWLGDTCELLVDVKTQTSNAETAYTAAKAAFNGSTGSFGRKDLIADLDGYNVAKKIVSAGSLSKAVVAYFTADLDEITRVQTFDAGRLSGVMQTTEAYRTAVSTAYDGNIYIKGFDLFGRHFNGLEDTYGVAGSPYDIPRTASINVVADYLLSYLPTVTSVAVTPATADVIVGTTQTYAAAVTGENRPSTAVTWAVTGATSASTTIDAAGKLTVGADETAITLTVTATSVQDTTKSASATATVRHPLVDSVAIVGSSTVDVLSGATHTFTADVTTEWGAADTVAWSVSGATSASTTIDAAGVLTIGADETATSLTVTATSTFDTTKAATATVNVRHPSVDGVSIVGDSTVDVTKGTTHTFTADVTTEWGAADTVAWSVSGATSASTTVDAAGVLTIGADETATSLTVTATSTFDATKTASVTVNVKDPTVVDVVVNTVNNALGAGAASITATPQTGDPTASASLVTILSVSGAALIVLARLRSRDVSR